METLVTIGFASFTITYLVRYTDGPLGVFYTFRDIIGLYKYEDGEEEATNWFAELVECFPCFTTWVSLFLCLVATKLNILDTVLIWFASVAVSLVLWKFVRGDG